jgi:hypothetical protein
MHAVHGLPRGGHWFPFHSRVRCHGPQTQSSRRHANSKAWALEIRHLSQIHQSTNCKLDRWLSLHHDYTSLLSQYCYRSNYTCSPRQLVATVLATRACVSPPGICWGEAPLAGVFGWGALLARAPVLEPYCSSVTISSLLLAQQSLF